MSRMTPASLVVRLEAERPLGLFGSKERVPRPPEGMQAVIVALDAAGQARMTDVQAGQRLELAAGEQLLAVHVGPLAITIPMRLHAHCGTDLMLTLHGAVRIVDRARFIVWGPLQHGLPFGPNACRDRLAASCLEIVRHSVAANHDTFDLLQTAPLVRWSRLFDEQLAGQAGMRLEVGRVEIRRLSMGGSRGP